MVCASGARASLAALTLKTMGYEDVAVLDGGLKGWTDAGLPTNEHEYSGHLNQRHRRLAHGARFGDRLHLVEPQRDAVRASLRVAHALRRMDPQGRHQIAGLPPTASCELV